MAKRSKLSKEDVKGPDRFQRVSGVVVSWAEKNLLMVLGLVFGVFVAGLGYVLYGQYENTQVIERQGKFYSVEKPYLEKKSKFEEALALEKSLKVQTGDAKKKTEEELKKLAKPSGDINKDYADSIEQFKGFIKDNPKSISSIFAALHLADIYKEYSKTDESLDVVKGVSQNHRPETMVSGLLWSHLGNLYAEKGDCAQAQTTWQTVVNSAGSKFMEKELKLKMALCYQKTDAKKAKEMLKALAFDFPDSSSGRSAKKYLRGM